MAYTRGRCTNVDYCSLAAGKRDIEVKVGEDFVCPECARPLRSPPVSEGSSRPALAIAGGAVALVLVGGGIYAGYRLSSPAAAPRAAVPAAAPVSVATASSPVAPVSATPLQPPAQAAAQPRTAAPAPAAEPAKVEPATLLRLAASPSLAGLGPRMAAAYLASLGDTSIVRQPGADGSVVVTGLRVGRPEAISITTGDEAGAFAALGRGAADIGMVSRRIGTQEQEQFRNLGNPAASGGEHVVALDGAAIVVNPRNPVTGISLAQLRGVLDGSIGRWSQLGAPGGGVIRLVASGAPAADGLRALVPGAPPVPHGVARPEDAAASVMMDPDAIALVPWPMMGRAKVLAVAEVGARPALPSAAAIADGTYPLARKLYFTMPANGSNPFAERFIAFAVSPEGQAAVAQAGLVPLRVAPEAAAAPLTPKDRYKQLVSGATRLAADLHFEANSNKLDLHSAREVDRVWNFMMSDHTPPDHLVLLGFADNQGTPEANLSLSQQRAQAVASVFAHRGLPPGQVVAFGSDLPLADNASEIGREKNRRVEVFLRN